MAINHYICHKFDTSPKTNKIKTKLQIADLKEHFRNKNYFYTSDIVEFYRKLTPNIPKTTVNWRVYELINKGVLERMGRGKFKFGETLLFKPKNTSKIIKVNNLIKKQLPFINYCIWTSNIINEFSLHINKINYTIIDTEREASKSVLFLLKDYYKHVFYKASKEMFVDYFPDLKNIIIIRDLVTEAPVQSVNKIPTVTIEKLLVDLYCDSEFEYLQGNELSYIYKNAFDKYTVNESKLLRYASRKGKKVEILKFINNQ